MFTNVPIKFKLEAMTQFEWDKYLRSEAYQHEIVLESITQIGAKIFGKDHARSNAYIHLNCQIRELKVTLKRVFDYGKNGFKITRRIYPIAHKQQGNALGSQSYRTQRWK